MSRLTAALVIVVQMFVSSAFQTRTSILQVPRGALRLSVFGRCGIVRPMVSRAEDAEASAGVSEDDSSQSPEKKPSSRQRRDYVQYAPPPDPSEFPDWAYEPRPFFHFEILHESSKSQARVGRIHTPHGIIDTPGFVAVATNAALKGVDFPDADQAGQQLIFSNTYHLLLHPGADIIGEAGGIQK
jgi:queuine tRNA-ribosyltransferase